MVEGHRETNIARDCTQLCMISVKSGLELGLGTGFLLLMAVQSLWIGPWLEVASSLPPAWKTV